ncbi:Secreted protein OS=Streptomyces microflavus OX=1919 GN=G3I39_41940 PE=4 SV=1 [Streptomyces microflavus]
MKIDSAALASVFGVSLVVTVALVGLFTVGIVSLSKLSATAGGNASGGSAALARTGAYTCFAACVAAVAYGIYLIVA